MRCYRGITASEECDLPKLIGFAVRGSAGEAPDFESLGTYYCAGDFTTLPPEHKEIFQSLRLDCDLACKPRRG